MRILHVSFAIKLQYNDPEIWLKRINFFTGLLEQLALKETVLNINLINYQGVIRQNGVAYHFIRPDVLRNLFPCNLLRYLRQLDPDVVFVHGLIFPWHVLLLKLFLKKRVRFVVQYHAEKPLRWHKAVLQKIVDQYISIYFFTSDAQAKDWIDAGQIKDDSKIHEVMEVSSVFGPVLKNIAVKHTGVPANLIYLSVGRLDNNKDPVTLVKAFQAFIRDYTHARLYMIFHDDTLLNTIKGLLREMPSCNIFLIGNVPHEKMLYWFNSADFIISTSHYEGSGVAVCEGMSCGCIPILSSIPSFQMMTNNGECGLLFEPGDEAALHSALLKSTNLNLAAEREKVLKQFDKKLSFKAIATKMLSVINEKV